MREIFRERELKVLECKTKATELQKYQSSKNGKQVNFLF